MTVVAIALAYLVIGAALYLPFVWRGDSADPRERVLATVLPDPSAASAVLARLRRATARVREMDEVLARPDPHGVAVRLRALRARRLEDLAAIEALIERLVALTELAAFGGDDGTEPTELAGELLARVECLAE